MKKLHVVMLALFAVFAFSATIVASASAEETLLAVWLINGTTEVKEGEKLATTGTGTLLLEDSKAPIVGNAGVTCEGLLDGFVEGNGQDLVTEVLTPTGVLVPEKGLVEGTGLKCKNELNCAEGDAELWPVNLPWMTLAELMSTGVFLDILYGPAGKEPGYELLCLILGVNVVDECTGNTSSEILNITGGIEAMFGAAFGTESANCSQGGAASGQLESVGANLTSLNEGGTLSVSSE